MNRYCLRPFELRWLYAILGVLFPPAPSAGLFVGICDMPVEAFFADVFAKVPKVTSVGIRAAIWVVAFAPFFVIGRPRTIAGLSPADRERVIVRLSDSRFYLVRQLVLILKTFAALLYTQAIEVREKIGGGLAMSRLPQNGGPAASGSEASPQRLLPLVTDNGRRPHV